MESADSWLSPRNFQIRQARKMDEFSRCVSLRATIALIARATTSPYLLKTCHLSYGHSLSVTPGGSTTSASRFSLIFCSRNTAKFIFFKLFRCIFSNFSLRFPNILVFTLVQVIFSNFWENSAEKTEI
nr:protein W10C8.3 [imported] - Caenorhabditis elegans [Caenorhabditis elegans]